MPRKSKTEFSEANAQEMANRRWGGVEKRTAEELRNNNANRQRRWRANEQLRKQGLLPAHNKQQPVVINIVAPAAPPPPPKKETSTLWEEAY